jgi:hypothetical protein
VTANTNQCDLSVGELLQNIDRTQSRGNVRTFDLADRLAVSRERKICRDSGTQTPVNHKRYTPKSPGDQIPLRKTLAFSSSQGIMLQ